MRSAHPIKACHGRSGGGQQQQLVEVVEVDKVVSLQAPVLHAGRGW